MTNEIAQLAVVASLGIWFGIRWARASRLLDDVIENFELSRQQLDVGDQLPVGERRDVISRRRGDDVDEPTSVVNHCLACQPEATQPVLYRSAAFAAEAVHGPVTGRTDRRQGSRHRDGHAGV